MIDDEKIIAAFGKILKEHREAKGLTQEQLAHAIQSHSTHISRLENGHKQPTLITIFKIAACLDMKPVELISKIKFQ
ncbi:helix-turn-helix domain-containing protein [Reichenbachiella versicolor]|uniref:helix-turn-helix domain-containing protein n=1 Tax=Reichenbachiella versicolor TaxID=1821036 RepID=UPI000D6E910F|nr:helix-turn-helix transcriptional regulator [Reichenbachiella versicolor]